MLNEKRVIAVFGAFLLMFSIILGNLFLLSSNSQYALKVQNQTTYTLPLYNGRAIIYDCNLTPLTNTASNNYVLALPGEQDYRQLFNFVEEDEKNALYAGNNQSAPFLVKLKDNCMPDESYVFSVTQRYGKTPIAVHTIGYINKDGNGVTGIEKAFDNVLQQGYDKTFVRCKTNARGALQLNSKPYITANQGTGSGVVLTIDDTIQRICEGIAYANITKGSIVVIETATGKIKASVSVPAFDPYNVEQSILNGDTALINRSESAFNVGSVFKPLLAAAALNNGYNPETEYECKGYIEVAGHIYRCANLAGHGTVNMKSALEKSCNCYFINLGLSLGGDSIYDTASLMGFGMPSMLGGGYQSDMGSFPSRESLKNLGQLASISFGQGELLATPIQVASFFNTFANDGVYISPTLVEGLINCYTKQITENFYSPQQTRVISHENAELIKDMLVSVIQNGRAAQAQPTHWNAGGKTGTAQTGRYKIDPETGETKEIYEIWFAGFYPADKPQYTIVVMRDENDNASDNCCEIFAKICDSLYYYL